MKTGIVLGVFALVLGGVLGAQQDPANPFPNHEPPPDYHCRPARDAHDLNTVVEACSCLGMMLDPVCSTKDENIARQNSGKCKAWCKLDQCACAVQCIDSAIRRPIWQTALTWFRAKGVSAWRSWTVDHD